MLRVYLRWPEQRVSNKTTTPSNLVADAAYLELINNPDLHGKPCVAIMSDDTQQQKCFDFLNSPLHE